MIRKYCESDKKYMDEAMANDIYQNVYLYIDSKTFGYETDNVKTWIVEVDNSPSAILYQYYNSLQVFQIAHMDKVDLLDIVSHIKEHGYEMISGKFELLNDLNACMEQEYILSHGCVMSGENCQQEASGKSRWAVVKECEEIAKLICSDVNIGGHYSVALLTEQLQDRMKNWNCKNCIVVVNNEIVSHMATYADIDDIAVLGGLVTKESSRGMGYGKIALNDLTVQLQKENKIPILYCYDSEIIEWYKKQDWMIVSECGKLERKR